MNHATVTDADLGDLLESMGTEALVRAQYELREMSTFAETRGAEQILALVLGVVTAVADTRRRPGTHIGAAGGD